MLETFVYKVKELLHETAPAINLHFFFLWIQPQRRQAHRIVRRAWLQVNRTRPSHFFGLLILRMPSAISAARVRDWCM